MLKFEQDSELLSRVSNSESGEGVQRTSTAAGDIDYDEADDDAASLGAPLPAFAGGGADQTLYNEVPKAVWSEAGHGIGFLVHCDMLKRVLYAKLAFKGSEVESGERALKRAVTKLFDIAEVKGSKRITVGLAPEDVGNPEFVCSLLYLGFQVIPPRKSPFQNIGLMLDFQTGYTSGNDTCTGTSECSTSAEDEDDDLESEETQESD